MSLRICKTVLGEIEGEARSAFPQEAGGLLLGRGRGVSQRRALSNRAEGQRRCFQFAPEDLARGFALAHESGLEVIGVYHSHPEGMAVPSSSDHSGLPSYCVNLIVSLDAQGNTEVRGFTRKSLEASFDEINVDIIEPTVREIPA